MNEAKDLILEISKYADQGQNRYGYELHRKYYEKLLKFSKGNFEPSMTKFFASVRDDIKSSKRQEALYKLHGDDTSHFIKHAGTRRRARRSRRR